MGESDEHFFLLGYGSNYNCKKFGGVGITGPLCDPTLTVVVKMTNTLAYFVTLGALVIMSVKSFIMQVLQVPYVTPLLQ